MRPASARPLVRLSLPLLIGLLVGVVALSRPGGSAQAAGQITVDGSVKVHQSTRASTISATGLTTTHANDLVVAFLASDGPSAAGSQSFRSVSGGGLSWKLAQRTNTAPGTAEVWEAVAPSPLNDVTVTATRSSGSYVGSMDVVAFSGADTSTLGATGSASAASGAPQVSLTATASGSWVWGVGDDWDNALGRTVGSGQTLYDQDLAGVGDTYWVQSQTSPGATAGQTATLNDTAPTSDRYDFSSVEIRPATPDSTPPSQPTGLIATATSPTTVVLSWSPSTDNAAVAGYDILRNGALIGNANSTTYTDTSASPSTTYAYSVEAFDAAGNISTPSEPASVTTPAASTSPPVISDVTTSAITTTSATISWTTDQASDSEVLYGPTLPYGQSTTLDPTLVASHSQTLSGLTPGQTYHFAVQSATDTSSPATSPDATFTTLAASVTLPDMQIKVPASDISIGTNSSTGHRQLQFTHITWDAGPGPFELDPTYNSATGTASFQQAIYASSTPGKWTYDYSVPVAATGVFDSPSDYQFPLTKFTLNQVNNDGSIGSVVATSPKTDYCITGDTYVGGVPNTPAQTYIPQSNCTNPSKPLGWSVGWGDEYDQTDNGQPIDLTGVPDGTYILEGTVDPDHVLTETDPTNNVVDTKLQITGTSVTVLGQTNPGTTPPAAQMTSPANDASVSGTVTLSASATPGPGASVNQVQFLLDGQPLGAPVTTAPYTINWSIGSTPLGDHTLSAQVTDSDGDVSTAAPITVDVLAGGGGSGPPSVSITNPTANETVSGTIPVAATATATATATIASVQFYLDGTAIGAPVTSAPYAISWDTTTASNASHILTAVATDSNGNATTSAAIPIVVGNPAAPMTCFVMQANVSVHGTGKLTTAPFHTAMAGEKLIAFVSSDGPQAASAQSVTVSGAGLTWTLVKRANAQPGDAEVWQATASSVLTGATVSSTPAKGGYAEDLTVIAMEDVSGVGASVAGSASGGAPSLTLTTQGSTSLVFAVGDDWDNAIPRTLPPGWALLDQWTNSTVGDDYWSQYTNVPTGAAGQTVTVGDSQPTTDRWNLVGVELLNDDG